jgi:hypothetical protein
MCTPPTQMALEVTNKSLGLLFNLGSMLSLSPTIMFWSRVVKAIIPRQTGEYLLLVGEEIHDRTRQPQCNHLLVLGANRELAAYAAHPQRLIEQVQRAEGLAFIAHPYDRPLAAMKEEGIGWDDWSVRGYTGIEIWNAFSELKERAQSKLQGSFTPIFHNWWLKVQTCMP